jgi:hypothetical protein
MTNVLLNYLKRISKKHNFNIFTVKINVTAFKGSEHIAVKVYTDNMSIVVQQIKKFHSLECSPLCVDNNSICI